jgi:hypothetical protein
VQEDDGAVGGVLDRLHHAIEIKALSLGGEVGVCSDVQADIGEDLVVVGPCWV